MSGDVVIEMMDCLKLMSKFLPEARLELQTALLILLATMSMPLQIFAHTYYIKRARLYSQISEAPR